MSWIITAIAELHGVSKEEAVEMLKRADERIQNTPEKPYERDASQEPFSRTANYYKS